jgi:tetratricopeptide (TPR) repeat protein
MQWDYDASFSLYEAGRSAMKAGDVHSAIENFRRSTKLAPHFKTLELLGECLLQVGEINDAVLCLAAAAGLGTRQLRARRLLAEALLRVGETDTAVAKLEEALLIDPDFNAAKDLLAKLKITTDPASDNA